MGLEGVAGAGKTTSLSATREAVECEGYQVIGLAPTSRAAHKLAESGIESGTLQRHLIRPEAPTDGQKRLFVIDESSLAGTKQMNEFFHRLHTADHVLLVGDSIVTIRKLCNDEHQGTAGGYDATHCPSVQSLDGTSVVLSNS
jgi:ATP-dependent exoDNAse (exonuclease V) alpha subunit